MQTGSSIAKGVFVASAAILLASCGSLETKSSQLRVGNTKSEVRAVMGSANYSKADGNLEIWQYATVAGFGYCDYRRVWFWKGEVTAISSYHHASIAGCSAGLKHIDWAAAMDEAPITSKSSVESSVTSVESLSELDAIKDKDQPAVEPSKLADELEKLEKLHASGALTDAEFEQAKRKLLNQK